MKEVYAIRVMNEVGGKSRVRSEVESTTMKSHSIDFKSRAYLTSQAIWQDHTQSELAALSKSFNKFPKALVPIGVTA